MVALKGEVVMLDGSRQGFTAHQWELSEWERYALRHGLPTTEAAVTFSMYVAFAAVHRTTWDEKPLGFEAWSRQVASVELEDTEEAEVSPFPKAASVE